MVIQQRASSSAPPLVSLVIFHTVANINDCRDSECDQRKLSNNQRVSYLFESLYQRPE